MDWNKIKPDMVRLVGQLTGLRSPSAVCWDDAPEASAIRTLPCVTLEVVSGKTVGPDVKTYEGAGPDRKVTLKGNRGYVVQVTVQGDAKSDPKIYTDRVAVRIQRTSSRDTLQALNLALSQVGGIITRKTKFDAREKFFSVIELYLNGTEVDTDDTVGSDDVIEKVNFEANELKTQGETPVTVNREVNGE